MKNEKSRPLLILGCQRSGTTLLAAMLGGHSEINMLFESTSDDTFRLIGKKYSGNKLLTYRQIRMNQRASRMGHIINRLINFHFVLDRDRHHKRKGFPTSICSVDDYISLNSKIVVIRRDKKEVIESIVARTPLSKKQANKEYCRSMELLDQLKNKAHHVAFSDLVHDPVTTLSGICNYLGLAFEERMLQGVEYNFVYPNSSILKEKSKNRNVK